MGRKFKHRKLLWQSFIFVLKICLQKSDLAYTYYLTLVEAITRHQSCVQHAENCEALVHSMYKSQRIIVRSYFCHHENFKGCVCYIFVSLFFKSKGEHLWNKEKCFLFHLKSSFHSQENQILEFYIFKFHDVIKCLSIKQEIDFGK